MRFNLRTRLSISYIFVAMVCVMLISLAANLILERQFQGYVRGNLERSHRLIIERIRQQYLQTGGLRKEDIEAVGIAALEQGMILQIRDGSGKMIWDATVHNNGMCHQMLMHLSRNMLSRYPNWKANYKENRYPIRNNFKTIGTVTIGHYGPFYLNDTDLDFINTLNRILTVITLLVLMIALFVGWWMAKRIGDPIVRVIDSAERIAKGDYDLEHFEATQIKELYHLTHTMDALAQELKKQETLRKRLTADVAHELRTPLATLQSHLEAMQDGVWQLDDRRLQGLLDEVTRLNRMVKDLNKLAKYDRDHEVLRKTKFNLSELVQQIVYNFEPEFSAKGVTLSFQGDPLWVEADRDKMSQMIINLIANGLKFTPTDGKVEISIEGNGSEAVLYVRDNGIGIDAEDLPYIFERFYRADKSRNRSTGGSGIGLTITKAIVEAHGGRIMVESQPGRGTQFVVALPIHAA
ncbi:MAG TPA: ATP-binding protein [Bacillota bacterium]|nr:ATP-binding protein [Bacillota bacterium]